MIVGEAQPADEVTDEPVRLHALTYLEEDGEVVAGRADTDSYGLFPPDGAALLQKLETGVTSRDAAQWYQATYGEPVDMAEFLDTLDELGFLVKPGEVPVAVAPVRWQRLGAWMFSPAVWACYVLIVGAAGAAMIVHPRLLPHPGNLFFTRYMAILELTVFLGQWPLLLLHEAFHTLAGRRLGLRSSLGVGMRLYYVVFETTLDGLVAVPRRQRYLPMLAGMLCDLLVIAVLTLVGAVTIRPDGTVPLVGGVCLALAFATLLRLVWQFYFYLRTDLYYVAVTVLGCVDLQAAAQRIMANRLRRLARRPLADESVLHPRDRAVGRWYSWLIAAGYTFSIVTLLIALVPIGRKVLGTVFGRFTHGGHPWPQVADSVLFLGLNLAELTLILFVSVRSRRTSVRPREGSG
jgi:hypothetical protein